MVELVEIWNFFKILKEMAKNLRELMDKYTEKSCFTRSFIWTIIYDEKKNWQKVVEGCFEGLQSIDINISTTFISKLVGTGSEIFTTFLKSGTQNGKGYLKC